MWTVCRTNRQNKGENWFSTKYKIKCTVLIKSVWSERLKHKTFSTHRPKKRRCNQLSHKLVFIAVFSLAFALKIPFHCHLRVLTLFHNWSLLLESLHFVKRLRLASSLSDDWLVIRQQLPVGDWILWSWQLAGDHAALGADCGLWQG